jgi:hypothetical protein
MVSSEIEPATFRHVAGLRLKLHTELQHTIREFSFFKNTILTSYYCSPARILQLYRILETSVSCVRRFLVTASVVPSSPILVTLMKKALRSSETSVLTRATRRKHPRRRHSSFLMSHRTLQTHRTLRLCHACGRPTSRAQGRQIPLKRTDVRCEEITSISSQRTSVATRSLCCS